MELIIRINLDNAAFVDRPEFEIEEVLRQVVYRMSSNNPEASLRRPLRDSYGNTVGYAEIK